jgi:hypothetical protein
MKTNKLKRNLEKERIELLKAIKKEIPEPLLNDIEYVASIVEQPREIDIKMSNKGAHDAK